jgi:hypothetical protein
VLHGIYPHPSEGEGDTFTGGYWIDREFVTEVLRSVTEADNEGEALTFYQLEDRYFPGKRHEIALVLRYVHNAGGNWAGNVWEALLRDCPSEARDIRDDWGSEEDLRVAIGECR